MNDTTLHGAALAAHEAKATRDEYAAGCLEWVNCDGAAYDVAPIGFVRIRRGDYFTVIPAGSEVKNATTIQTP